MQPIYRNRGYLPHIEDHASTYFITLRLAGTLPRSVLERIQADLNGLRKSRQTGKLPPSEEQRLKYLETIKIQNYLDRGFGDCWLKRPEIAGVIKEAVEHHDGQSYASHICCIMPNHLHWILTPTKKKDTGELDSLLIPIMQRFKSFTAHTANTLLKRTGSFWSREYYDHRVRSSEEFYKLVQYTLQNPVKAHLCTNWKDWRWTILSRTLADGLSEDGI